MSQSIRYFSLALQTIKLLQSELIRQLQKNSDWTILEFKKTFHQHLNQIKNVQLQKSIQQQTISSCLTEMENFLQKQLRTKNTSHSERYKYKASFTPNENHRMRQTARSFDQRNPECTKEKDLSEVQSIIQSYKIMHHPLKPQTRMKWRSPVDESPIALNKQKNKSDMPNSNSIEILKFTIPELQNRIKILSLNKKTPQHGKQFHRTLQTRTYHTRRYIARLF